ncbi:hypothetical protein K435DRAFT_779890 [Dendrothele bispora CBS 962.96]|uniref:Uncharacterized protein n=1 Tax=Dendrothele bispora (strain CBS 962.96) TaxID=1314807 RepID=A0A4S8LWB0_DENBC|nr:hypothetical protein K435DRAFT_779890 [Dendrothele bispora CBS 962.96]
MSKRKAPSSGVSRSTKSTTKSTTSSGTRRTFGGSSVFTGSENMTEVSSIKFSPNTERQMEIDERIQELQGKLALLQRTISNGNGLGREGKTGSVTLANMTHDYRVWKWKKQIDRLKALKDSDWAWGKTDVVPPGLYKYDGTSTFNQS